MKDVEKELAEKSVSGKNEIKDKYNQMASKVQVNTRDFITALLGEETPLV